MRTFDLPITDLARALIGAKLLVRGVGGTVLETEAYGRDDPASHSFRGPTPRNAAMFGPPGSVYVYLSYGCHMCLNVVGRTGEAVLIRALRPEIGLPLMRERRGREDMLASGPGRVGQALAVGLADNGKLFSNASIDLDEFTLRAGTPVDLLVGPRIGIVQAADRPWRFGLAGMAGLSRPFSPSESTVPKRAR
jgi:DNA-3-methyladenine glycosylase